MKTTSLPRILIAVLLLTLARMPLATVAKDGALLVSDDTGDCIWRVSYANPG